MGLVFNSDSSSSYALRNGLYMTLPQLRCESSRAHGEVGNSIVSQGHFHLTNIPMCAMNLRIIWVLHFPHVPLGLLSFSLIGHRVLLSQCQGPQILFYLRKSCSVREESLAEACSQRGLKTPAERECGTWSTDLKLSQFMMQHFYVI